VITIKNLLVVVRTHALGNDNDTLDEHHGAYVDNNDVHKGNDGIHNDEDHDVGGDETDVRNGNHNDGKDDEDYPNTNYENLLQEMETSSIFSFQL
jgi:hypothetical protein